MTVRPSPAPPGEAATLAPAADHSIGPTGPLAEKAKGLESQAFVSQWFTKPGEVLVHTIKEEKYARMLADCYRAGEPSLCTPKPSGIHFRGNPRWLLVPESGRAPRRCVGCSGEATDTTLLQAGEV